MIFYFELIIIIYMDQTEQGGWEHEEQFQNIYTELPQNVDLFRTQSFKRQLSQKSQSGSKNQQKMQAKHSLPLLVGQKKSKLSCNYTQQIIYQSRSQRNRCQVQEKARKLLIEESENHPKMNHTHQYFLRNQNTQNEDNQIEGFCEQDFPFARIKKKVKQQIKSFKQTNTKTNQQKQLSVARSKRRSLLLHTQHSHQQMSKQVIIQKSVQKKTQPNQLIKKILYKISNLKNINATFDTQENWNKNILLMQQKLYRKRPSFINYSYKRKRNNTVDDNTAYNQNSLALYTRKIIYSQKKKDNYNDNSQDFQKFRLKQKMLQTHSQIFQPLNPKLQNKRQNSYKTKSKSVNQKPQKLNKYQQSMINIFNQLKQTKRKENLIKGSVKYQKLKKKNQTIHNIHSNNDRQESAMKFQWNKQRTKLRNICTKSETVDILKLSLMAEENRKTIRVIDNALNHCEIKVQKKRIKTQSSQTRQNHWQIISPIFLNQK